MEYKNTVNVTSSFPKGDLDVLEQSLYDYDKALLETLLIDRTTGKNIKWGTSDYSQFGDSFKAETSIFVDLVTGAHSSLIQPRAAKSKEEQERRTKDKAEVFTPSWICNKQNNLVDREWFGRKRVFNREVDKTWTAIKKPIEFSEVSGRTWQDYVKADRLEITCGEAPYLVSRYDTTTGEVISVYRRIGLLDRKLRVVGENTTSEESWHSWATEAFKSIYGFDYQGDNVLLARENLLYTYADFVRDKFDKDPDPEKIHEIANIISWNIWQMDGIEMTIPFSKAKKKYVQNDLSAYLEEIGIQIKDDTEEALAATIMDWKSNTVIEFRSLVKG